MWVSSFCFVIGVEFSVIYCAGKLTINEIKRNCILNTLEIFYLHILYFPSERKTNKTKSTPIEKTQWTPSSSWQQEPRSSPISLKQNVVLFPNTATTGIKYALILAAKIVFWPGTISANLKNLSLIWIAILLTSPRCLSWMCLLVSF